MGIFLPYFNLYLDHLGASGAEIGTLSAVRSITMIAFTLAWAHIADRRNARRGVYIFCSLAAVAAWSLFFAAESFPFLLVAVILYGIFHAPIVPFLEAFTMEALGGEKRRYGRIRVWGTLSFVAVVAVLGRVMDTAPLFLIVPLIFAGLILRAAFALRLPAPIARGAAPAVSLTDAKRLFSRRVVLFLVCGFLMLAGHAAYYGFFSIHLERLGFSNTFIGFSWALASFSEVSVMVFSHRIFRRFTPEAVLVFSFIVAALRWGVLGEVEGAAPILATQLAHAVTYGTFHIAGILYIDRLSPPGKKTSGQAVNNGVSYGLGLMTGFFISGRLFDAFGAHLLFTGSAVVSLAAALLFAAGVLARGTVDGARSIGG
jgi:PPP family 3-phenylpropionic acid transporter